MQKILTQANLTIDKGQMNSGSSKREQLQPEEMREYLLDIKSFERQSIEELDENNLKTLYYKVIKEEKQQKAQQEDNQMQQKTPQNQKPEKKKQNSKTALTTAKKHQEENDDYSAFSSSNEGQLSSNKILEILTINLPESADKLRLFSPEELQQLYNQLLQSNQNSKKHSPEQAKMRKFVASNYPHLKGRLSQLSQKEVRDLYDTYSVDSSFSNTFANRYGEPMNKTSPNSNPSFREQGKINTSEYNTPLKKQMISTETMKRELKRLIPEQCNAIDSFNDSEIEQLYQEEVVGRGSELGSSQRSLKLQQPQKQQPKKQKKKKRNDSKLQLPLLYQKTTLSDIGSSNTIKQGSVDHSKPFVEWQHKDGSGIKARTYILIHTEYDNPLKSNKYLNPLNGNNGCSCSLCQNNTLQNLFKELKAFVDHHKK